MTESDAQGQSGSLGGFADEDEFAKFYRQTSAALHGYIAKITGNPTAADDILQMAYMRLLSARPPEESLRRPYLYRAASSIIIDQWRRLSRERRYQESHEFVEPYSRDAEGGLDLRRLFEHLSDRERALLWLAYADGFSHSEIAAILRIAEKSVKVMLFRVREKAKVFLSKASPGVGKGESE